MANLLFDLVMDDGTVIPVYSSSHATAKDAANAVMGRAIELLARQNRSTTSADFELDGVKTGVSRTENLQHSSDKQPASPRKRAPAPHRCQPPRKSHPQDSNA